MPRAQTAGEYAVRLFRSLRDATRHRRLSAPSGGQRFALPDELVDFESPQGHRMAMRAKTNQKLVQALLTQEHPAFCAVASAMTIAQAEGVGPGDQKRFVDIFRQAASWPPVMACYGLDALDSLPGLVKYVLLSHLQYDGAPLALLAEWLRVLDFDVQIKSSGNLDEDVFRADVAACYPSSEISDETHSRNYMLVNYSRWSLSIACLTQPLRIKTPRFSGGAADV
eukprot:symbB.v1.2.004447.t1/scaffold249.1/size274694/6